MPQKSDRYIDWTVLALAVVFIAVALWVACPARGDEVDIDDVPGLVFVDPAWDSVKARPLGVSLDPISAHLRRNADAIERANREWDSVETERLPSGKIKTITIEPERVASYPTVDLTPWQEMRDTDDAHLTREEKIELRWQSLRLAGEYCAARALKVYSVVCNPRHYADDYYWYIVQGIRPEEE
jgi:hypothetical protein